jgi:Zn-dependent peptidase ImmA (M78 family)
MPVRLSNKRYEEIKLIVVDMFKKYDISCVPICGFEIVKRMGINVLMYSALTEEQKKACYEFSEDGFSLFYNGKWTIYINNITTGYERQNNTILHEIGHIVLNHTEDSELADSEANFFAKYALVPPILVYKFKLKTIGEIMKKFNVSKEAARYALDYYDKWFQFSGNIKLYEIETIKIFKKCFEIVGGDVVEV